MDRLHQNTVNPGSLCPPYIGKQLVLYCIDKNIALDDMSLEEYKAISPVFEEDIYEAISMKTCVEMRNTIGAPGKSAMEQAIALEEAYLKEE